MKTGVGLFINIYLFTSQLYNTWFTHSVRRGKTVSSSVFSKAVPSSVRIFQLDDAHTVWSVFFVRFMVGFFVFCWLSRFANWYVMFRFWNWARNFASWFISLNFISLMVSDRSLTSLMLVFHNNFGCFHVRMMSNSCDVGLRLFNMFSMMNKLSLFCSCVSRCFGFTLCAMSISFSIFGNNNLFMCICRILWIIRFQSFCL